MAGVHQVSSLKMSTAVLLQSQISLWNSVYSHPMEIFRLTFPIYSRMVKELHSSNIATLAGCVVVVYQKNCVQAVLKGICFLALKITFAFLKFM